MIKRPFEKGPACLRCLLAQCVCTDVALQWATPAQLLLRTRSWRIQQVIALKARFKACVNQSSCNSGHVDLSLLAFVRFIPSNCAALTLLPA